MLSYLHAYHAGNHADVLKHTVLLAVLARLTEKDKPIRYVDTHAGAGGYDLRAPAAQQNAEHRDGIGRIWTAADAPEPVARLLARVRDCNRGAAELTHYPGSPWLAREALRHEDKLYLFELHPAEHKRLARDFDERRITVLREDGLTGCIGLLPPPDRRGLLLIDPAYELKDEHSQVVDALAKAHRRFATGVFAIWYPVIERRWAQRFERAVRATGIGPLNVYELCVAPDGTQRGLTGSGMIVVNPPWTLRDEMEVALPWLAAKLGMDGAGSYRIAE